MHALSTYLPQDRRRALTHNAPLSTHTSGAALFADISGFTALTETLTRELGARRGIEELTRQINEVYAALVGVIECYAGSVIDFAGDAIIGWFEGDTGLRAVSAALALQAKMPTFGTLGLKVAVTSGAACRFVVGDPQIRVLDTLAGRMVARLATAEHLAQRGEVLIDAPTAQTLTGNAAINTWRTADTGELFAVATGLHTPAPMQAPVAPETLPAETVRPWIQPAVFEREQSGHGDFLTELRPAVAVFVRFTGIEYDDDPQAEEQLSALITRTQTILQHYEGTLLQLTIGDKGSYLYGAFGTPIAHEDDARRAVQSALEILRLPQDLLFLDSLQIGISKGLMRTGAYGGPSRRTYGALGDEVNLAARLMTSAASGEILVSRAVQKTSGTEFVFKAYPPLHVKGKAEPVPVFSVTGKGQHRAIRLEEPYYTLPMAGRQRELGRVQEQLVATMQGRGQVVGVTGEAGLGKSRLVAEVIRLAYQRGFAGYGGACEAFDTNTPYLVWKAVWQAFFDVDPSLPLPQQLLNLEQAIKTSAPTHLPAMPLLSVLLDIPIEENEFTRTLKPEDRRSLLMHILSDFLASTARPVLIVLEDVHWIDPLSLDLLESLALASANRAVCFVIAYRPLASARPGARRIEDLPGLTVIALDQLPQEDVARLIDNKLAQLFPMQGDTLAQGLVEKLCTRAEGNPFYIEELLNYLRDRGVNPYLEDTLDTLELPTNLHALILSRIDRLSEAQKVMLKTASVIGRLFSLAWLCGYYPALGEHLHVKTDMDALERMDITLLDTPEPDSIYLFRHIVTHEVAYESISYAMRMQLHEQLARWLEASPYAGQSLELLAYHWRKAENALKAIEYLEQAGADALQNFANDAAVAFYAGAIALEKQCTEPIALERRVVWHVNLGRAYAHLSKYDESLLHLEMSLTLVKHNIPARDNMALQAAQVARELSVQLLRHALPQQTVTMPPLEREFMRAVSQAYTRLIEVYYYKGLFTLASWATLRGLNLIERLGPSPELAETYGTMAVFFLYLRMPKISVGYARRALEMVNNAEHLGARVMVAMSVGSYYTGTGQWPAAHAQFELQDRIVKEVNNATSGYARIRLHGYVLQYQGRFREGLALADRLVVPDLARRDKRYYANGLCNRAHCLFHLGRTAEALQALTELEQMFTGENALTDQPMLVETLGLLAGAYARLGDVARARAASARALTFTHSFEAISHMNLSGYSYPVQVYQDWQAQEYVAGAALARTALANLQNFAAVFPVGLPRVHLYRGRAALLAGAPRVAQATWREGLTDALRLQMPYEEAHLRLALGQATEARDELLHAQRLFAQCEAQYDLAQVERALNP